MLIGYLRVSKADGSQTTDPQHDVLVEAGVDEDQLSEDLASGKKDDRCGLAACLKALRDAATLDTTTAAGKLLFGIFAALAEFERGLISERSVAGLAFARARGRVGEGVSR